MNMQGLQYSSIAKDHSVYFCVCENPQVDTSMIRTGDDSLICKNCSRPLRKIDIKKTRQLMILRDLREISEAKNNIRNTLKLEMKKNPKRSSEFEFLLKRL